MLDAAFGGSHKRTAYRWRLFFWAPPIADLSFAAIADGRRSETPDRAGRWRARRAALSADPVVRWVATVCRAWHRSCLAGGMAAADDAWRWSDGDTPYYADWICRLDRAALDHCPDIRCASADGPEHPVSHCRYGGKGSATGLIAGRRIQTIAARLDRPKPPWLIAMPEVPTDLFRPVLAEIAGYAEARRCRTSREMEPRRHCGDSAMRIARDGQWFHEGSPIGRPAGMAAVETILRPRGRRPLSPSLPRIEKARHRSRGSHLPTRVELKRDGGRRG